MTKDENRRLLDLSRLEMAIIAPLLILIVLMGVYPKPFIERIAASAEVLAERVTMVAEREPGSSHEAITVTEASAGTPGRR